MRLINIITILLIFFKASCAFGNNDNYAIVIQRQSKEIQELKERVKDLENTIQNLKFVFVPKNKNKGESQDENKEFYEKKDQVSQEVSNNADDKRDYDLALATLKNGEFEVAKQKFDRFLKNHSSSNLRSNATFWYAESFYRNKEFDKSAINFLKTYKKYPNSSKASDALLKAAYSLGNLEKNDQACAILEKLESNFPSRSADSITRANEARKIFHCK